MAIVFASLLGMLLVPVSAFALSEEPVAANTFFSDPVFITVGVIGLVAVCSSAVMAGVLIHMRSVGCKNASCRYHPRASRTGGAFDFSLIETPQELVASSFEGGKAGEMIEVRVGDSSESRPESRSEERSAERSEERPAERPAMDFTDAMILQVLTTLEHQLQTLEERQEFERQQVHTLKLQRVLDRRSAFMTVEQQQEPFEQGQPFGQQQPFGWQQPFAQQQMTSERAILLEGTEQQTAIEWLALAAAPRGRHFRTTDSSQGTGTEMFAEDLLQRAGRSAKHARIDDSERFRRVS
jgi:hypothetical protein